jgi:hypothetical protein
MPADKRASFSGAADAVSAKLSAVESEIYQVENQSSQDPLNYPIKLNNKIAALSGVVGGAAAKPTSQSYTVFNDLSSQLERQLQTMRGTLLVLPSLNAALKSAGLPPIVPSTDEIKSPPRAASTEAAEEVDR